MQSDATQPKRNLFRPSARKVQLAFTLAGGLVITLLAIGQSLAQPQPQPAAGQAQPAPAQPQPAAGQVQPATPASTAPAPTTPAPADQAGPAPTVDEAVLKVYEEEAFDEIYFDDENEPMVRVQRLNLPERRRVDPSAHKKSEKLLVRRLDDPTDDYEIRWGDIVKIRLFEDVILDKALEIVHEGKANEDPAKFDEAYDYFDYMKHTHPEWEDLDRGLGEYLYEDAGLWHRRAKRENDPSKDENALTLLNELFAVYPTYPRLEAALGATTQGLVEARLARDDYASSRRLVRELAKKFPKSAVARGYIDRWSSEADQLIADGRRQLSEDEPREAWKSAQRVLHVFPSAKGAKRFFEDLYAAYPRVVVGVTTPLALGGEPRLTNWGVRRDARLLHRLLLEFIGAGSEGGLYSCPFGEVELTDIGRRLIFKLRPGIRWSAGDDHLTGYDVARQLMSLADASQPDFEPAWADLFAGVEVQDVYEVGVELRWSYVQPLALLETPLSPVSTTGAVSSVGPYVLGDNADGQVHFLSNPAYFAAGKAQPKEIVERYIADSKAGWAALDRGDIQLLDRLNPWEIDKFRSNDKFVVEEYAIPTIHCLVPNPQHTLMTHRAFRRAITYGINREVVLKHHLLHNAERSGCRVVSGPFPIGAGLDDPLRYAYNSRIDPRPWDPRLALALSAVALVDVSTAAQKRGEPEVKELPTLTLAHPAEEIAREACRAIQRHLKTVKINVTLRELPPGECRPTDDNYDLFYMQMMMQEPLVDAGRLLGADGAAGQASAYVTLALSQLASSANWRAASDVLHRIHRLASDDLAVIPLWQLTEHFAYHRSIKGISARPVLLYQEVERWEGKVLIPPEE